MLNKKARTYQQADAVFVSIPKSGRTWLRVFLYAYFAHCANRPFTISQKELERLPYPKIMFTHDRWNHQTTPSLLRRLRRVELIPAGPRRHKPIILLARDPRDVMVSLHLQLTKRQHWYVGGLKPFIRDERFGVRAVVSVMNGWIREWGALSHFMLMRYEDCRKNPTASFRQLLGFIGTPKIDPSAFEQSLAFSSFENMKRRELASTVDSKSLLAANADDPESFKVRRGKVGGYRDYLDEDDMAFMNRAVAELDDRFGYRRAPSPVSPVDERPETSPERS